MCVCLRYVADEDEVNLEIMWKSAYSHQSTGKVFTPKIPCFVNTCALDVGEEVKYLKEANSQSKGIKRDVVVDCSLRGMNKKSKV